MVSAELIRKIQNIKCVATDINGVWTDGSMYFTNDGEFMKRFSTYDGFGANLLQRAGFPVVILTGENSEPVKRRAEKLQIEHVHVGVKNKLPLMRDICDGFGITLNEVAYIGDDLNDLELLSSVGLSAMPINSPILTKFYPDYLVQKTGGKGAFREFADLILNFCESEGA